MRGRTLLVLLAALGAAIAFVFWLGPGREPAAESTPQGPLVVVDAPAIRRVEIASSEGVTFAIAREPSGAFRLEGGDRLEADASRVDGLFVALGDTRVERTVEGASDPATFGLAPAERTVRLEGVKGTTTVEVGRASPVGYRRYARVNGGPVVLVDGAIGAAVDRGRDDYVERRLLPMEATRVRRIEIDAPGKRIVLERTSSEWRIVEPFADRAELGVAENLARSMTAMTVDDLEAGDPAFSGGTRVRVAGEDAGPVREARIAPGPGVGRRAIVRLPGPVSGSILEAAARDLERDPEAMRDTRVTVFSSPEVRRLAWRASARSATARRDGGAGAWTREENDGSPHPLEPAAVEGLLDAARWLRASGFAKPTSAAPLSSLALEGADARLDLLEFVDDGVAGTLLVRATARPGVAARIARTSYDELAAKAEALAR